MTPGIATKKAVVSIESLQSGHAIEAWAYSISDPKLVVVDDLPLAMIEANAGTSS